MRTPGPWHAHPFSRFVRGRNGHLIATTEYQRPKCGANACHIAASVNAVEAVGGEPETVAMLVRELHDLVTENDKYGGCPRTSPAWQVARALLARCDGGAAGDGGRVVPRIQRS